ncbi:acetyl coenzyme A synthetase (ADP forming), alpha domain [Ruegeria sp. THAF57]|uniref:acetate--CoA ligase family protein n=1 Tax=Ruegeria sp. THAF57 TaxID=2744555 RepID=UPI0015DF9AEF|nr:acetate--CoA ligase family protein [Ruegeria sp. THAF57]CAD0184720.1 acetyl coenzyme A synthetase (ADP forming), alpha domain [Ruegeria sp. THAF57]
MTAALTRALTPESIAVIGGGAWCASVIQQARKFGFKGDIWPVHPKAAEVAGERAYGSLESLPTPPDLAFVGINRHATIQAVEVLSAMGAGGAVCFASGFTEAQAEDDAGADLQEQLIAAAVDMPILGPNCYGFVNGLDRVAVWPDQHGMQPVDRGVAILTQSSNIAINMTMQRRALPLAFMLTCGNQAQTHQADIALALLDDDRITAIGVHIEGFGDLRKWEVLANKARLCGVPIVALKMGRSTHAQAATISHTASLAGGDAGAQALLDRLGIARLDDIPSFLECLKLLHVTGRLESNGLGTISCSGGEASLAADMATSRDVDFPPLSSTQRADLREALGPMVALANPLDYHTYIWRDTEAMTRAWAAMMSPEQGLTMAIVDYPHTDSTDWDCATQAALNCVARSGRPFAVTATLPELMPEDVAQRLLDGGVVPFAGLHEALAAVEAASRSFDAQADSVLMPSSAEPNIVLTEAEAKLALEEYGVRVPKNVVAQPEAAQQSVEKLVGPFAVKGVGLAHKSDQGAVRLNVKLEDVARTASEIGTAEILIEEMAPSGVAELLIGVTRDPAHGYVLTLGAGGVLTEILRDSVSLLIPSSRQAVHKALDRLACAPLLAGYRGKSAADMQAILDTVDAVQAYVIANAAHVSEVEINPLICGPDGAVAVDALIRKASS